MKMEYELTPEEGQELNREFEYNHKIMKAMGCTPEQIEQKLKIIRKRVLNRIYSRRRYQAKKIEDIKIHEIMELESDFLDLLDKIFNILFPPEEWPEIPIGTRLFGSVGSRKNISYEATKKFVHEATASAERFFRKNNQKSKVDK